MNRQPVTSSNLVSVGYDSASGTLEVEFKDSTYQYYDVPESIYNGLMSASSKGSYLYQNIRDKFRYRKL
jgi:hypothetical protein